MFADTLIKGLPNVFLGAVMQTSLWKYFLIGSVKILVCDWSGHDYLNRNYPN